MCIYLININFSCIGQGNRLLMQFFILSPLFFFRTLNDSIALSLDSVGRVMPSYFNRHVKFSSTTLFSFLQLKSISNCQGSKNDGFFLKTSTSVVIPLFLYCAVECKVLMKTKGSFLSPMSIQASALFIYALFLRLSNRTKARTSQ